MYRRININNYSAEKWLLQLFPVDLIDYGNALPRKLQSPEKRLNLSGPEKSEEKNDEKNYKNYAHCYCVNCCMLYTAHNLYVFRTL